MGANAGSADCSRLIPNKRSSSSAGAPLMRILLINVPHPSIGSRIPDEHLPPLGLLSIGGPLIDAGHDVTLVDGDLENLPDAQIVRRVCALAPDVVMVGHSGSTSAHPVVSRVTRLLRVELPD